MSCIVTNPPFCLKLAFVKRCLELGKPFAMLMPTNFLAVSESYEVFHSSSFGCGVLCPKVNFLHKGKSYCVGDTAWYFWGFPHVPTDRNGFTWMEQLRHYSESQKIKMGLLSSSPSRDNQKGTEGSDVEGEEDEVYLTVKKGEVTYFVDVHNRVLLNDEIVGEFVDNQLILFDTDNLNRKMSSLSFH